MCRDNCLYHCHGQVSQKQIVMVEQVQCEGWPDHVLMHGECVVQSLPGVEGLAIATSCEFMMELQRSAIDNDIEPGPSCTGGWKPWLQAVKAAGQGHLPPGTPPGTPLSSLHTPNHRPFSPKDVFPCSKQGAH